MVNKSLFLILRFTFTLVKNKTNKQIVFWWNWTERVFLRLALCLIGKFDSLICESFLGWNLTSTNVKKQSSQTSRCIPILTLFHFYSYQVIYYFISLRLFFFFSGNIKLKSLTEPANKDLMCTVGSLAKTLFTETFFLYTILLAKNKMQ